MKLVQPFRKLPPWYFLLPSVLIGLAVSIPLVYLIIRALSGDVSETAELLFRHRNLVLFWNTVSLTLGVVLVTTLVAYPLAWLCTRTDIPAKKLITIIGVLPLALPGYVVAYAILGLGGDNGTLAMVFGLEYSRLSGYWGALLAVSLYTFPYLFLNLRAGFMGLDPSTEEAARSLGFSSFHILRKVTIPQLRPSYLAGVLIITLYVLGDFGAVSLMRFETFSYSLYIQYAASYDRVYAAIIALILLSLTIIVLIFEYKLLKGLLFYRAGTGTSRRLRESKLGSFKWMGYGFVGLITLFSLIIPIFTILFWMAQGVSPNIWGNLGDAIKSSVIVSAPAAILSVLMAIPLAYIAVRFPSKTSNLLQRFAYMGYATPPLALALAFIFFSLNVVPILYQTFALLIFAYALHFLAEAIGPVRSALYQASPKLEEAAMSLGMNRFKAFYKSTLPLLFNGIIVGASFVFLSAMKELPITFLLAPIGLDTLAVNVWSYSAEAMFAEAAPFALSILFFSIFFVGILFTRELKN